MTDPNYFIENKSSFFYQFIYHIATKYSAYIHNRMLFLVSPKLSYLFGVLQLEDKNHQKSHIYFSKSHQNSITRIPSLIKIADYFYQNDESEYKNIIETSFIQENLTNGITDSLMNWAWWETSHSNFISLLQKQLNMLGDIESSASTNLRLLPNHTSHLGHISFLKKYIDYYSNVDKDRVIGIWPDVSANKYYLNKVIESSPLKIEFYPGKPPSRFSNIDLVDRTLYSKMPNGNWRIEYAAGSFSGQEFPELSPQKSRLLSITSEEDSLAEYYLDKNRINKNKWFVCLHIRQAMPGSKVSIRAEDADINNYLSFCLTVNELGGQVIRMGDRNFPKLPKDYPAIDYAYSDFKSDFFDTWLWGRCRWWTGNFNGACLPSLTFGVPRLITDAWVWDVNGPSTDYILPKLLQRIDTNYTFGIKETINNKLSRNTKKERFKDQNLTLLNNSAEDLAVAAEFMYSKTILVQEVESKTRKSENVLAGILKVPSSSPVMSIPDFFSKKWFNIPNLEINNPIGENSSNSGRKGD